MVEPISNVRYFTIGLLGLSLGFATLNLTQKTVFPFFEKEEIEAKCGAGETESLVPYETYLGGSFVCLITQFFYYVAIHPGGIFVCSVILPVFIGFLLHFAVESGRPGAKGLITWPTVIPFIGQYLGISVTVPLLWLPSFCYGFSHSTNVHPTRVNIVYSISAILLVLGIVFANMERGTYAFGIIAGILGGPIWPLLMVGLSPFKDYEDSKVSTMTIVNGFKSIMVFSAICWYLSCFYIINYFGFHPMAIWKEIWTEEAHPAVKFMTIDVVVLSLAGILQLAVINLADAAEALIQTPIIGPGAALAYGWAKQEQKRAAQPKEEKKQ